MRMNMHTAVGIPVLLAAAIATSAWGDAGGEAHTQEVKSQVQTPAPKGTIVIRTAQESDFPSLATVSLQRAMVIALGQTPGGLLKAETEEENGFLVHHIEVVSADKSIVAFTIDAGTGAILRQAADQLDDDKDDDLEDDDD